MSLHQWHRLCRRPASHHRLRREIRREIRGGVTSHFALGPASLTATICIRTAIKRKDHNLKRWGVTWRDDAFDKGWDGSFFTKMNFAQVVHWWKEKHAESVEGKKRCGMDVQPLRPSSIAARACSNNSLRSVRSQVAICISWICKSQAGGTWGWSAGWSASGPTRARTRWFVRLVREKALLLGRIRSFWLWKVWCYGCAMGPSMFSNSVKEHPTPTPISIRRIRSTTWEVY